MTSGGSGLGLPEMQCAFCDHRTAASRSDLIQLREFVAFSFRISDGGRRVIVHDAPDETDAAAAAVMRSLLQHPEVSPSHARSSCDRLLAILWELSDGTWQRASALFDRSLESLKCAYQEIGRSQEGSVSEARRRLDELRSSLLKGDMPRPPKAEQATFDDFGHAIDSAIPITTVVPRRVSEVRSAMFRMSGLARPLAFVEEVVAQVEIDAARSAAGLPVTSGHSHLVLSGPPGSGKSTFARLYVELLCAMEQLASHRFVEVSRNSLVAKYVGHTAQRVSDVFAAAAGGAVFIDEAYSLAGDSFGREAIAEIVRQMENQRDSTLVLIAGYPESLDGLLRENPGFSSRFARVLDFSTLQPADVAVVIEQMALERGYLFSDAGREALLALPKHAGAGGPFDARWARNTVDAVVRAHTHPACREPGVSTAMRCSCSRPTTCSGRTS